MPTLRVLCVDGLGHHPHIEPSDDRFSLETADFTLLVRALEHDVISVRLSVRERLDANLPTLPYSWMVAPGAADVPYEGRHKSDTAGFECPRALLEYKAAGGAWSAWQKPLPAPPEYVRLSTNRMRVTILLARGAPLALHFAWLRPDGVWETLVRDRPSGAYYVGDASARDERVQHYLMRQRGDKYFGMGERSGNLDRVGRRVDMSCADAMGYDAEHGDPLYKFWPFFIRRSTAAHDDTSGQEGGDVPLGPAEHGPQSGPVGAACGLFYDNMARAVFDFGCELNNYHGSFSSYKADCGDLDYMVLLGPRVLEVTRRFAWLTGKMLLPPRWSLGYSGSTMTYTEAPDAQAQLLGFIDRCKAEKVPVSSFQLSSGYSSTESGKRHVFTWNRAKIPQPQVLARAFTDADIRLAANIKPVLLTDHPAYEKLRADGAFVLRPSASGPEVSLFWDAHGSHLDFTNSLTFQWWIDSIRQHLHGMGIECTWNDNNEYALDDEESLCHNFGSTPVPIKLMRPLMSMLMCKASYIAQKANNASERPWLISRSGMPGMGRYVQTWSGDNFTEWKTLRYNLRMGLGLCLSGCFNIGHDVGGFAGPPPSAELLVRWVQNGIFHPRFTMHSWNSDGSVTMPWLHPSHTALVVEAMHLRCAIIPYLYQVMRRASEAYEPPLRPTFLDHEDDPQAWEQSDDFLLGPSLLVANVVDEGARRREVYLPQNGVGWWHVESLLVQRSGSWYGGGQTISLEAPLERIPLLVAAGAMLPVDLPGDIDAGMRSLLVFPPPVREGESEGESTYEWTEDDGLSSAPDAPRVTFRCALARQEGGLRLSIEVDTPPSAWRPPFASLRVIHRGGSQPLRIETRGLGMPDAGWLSDEDRVADRSQIVRLPWFALRPE